MTKTENNILLFSITLCWATSYLFIKQLPEDFSSCAYLTMTTGIAALIMAVIFWKQLKKSRKSTWLKGFFLSLLLSVNLLAEKKGISLLTPSNASFLEALTVIIVPVLLLVSGQMLSRNHLAGAAVILIGLAVSSRFAVSNFYSRGSIYMLAACFCSAVYTIMVDRFAKEEDPLVICIIQMFFTALLGFVLWYMENPLTFASITYTGELLSSIFILAFFAKAYAYTALMYSQKYTDAVSVTVISSTEPVVTLSLSLLLPAAYGGRQIPKLPAIMGAVLIAAGAIIAGLHFLEKKRPCKNEEKWDENQ